MTSNERSDPPRRRSRHAESGRRAQVRPARVRRPELRTGLRRRLALTFAASLAVFGMAATLAIAPKPAPTQAQQLAASIQREAQTLTVSGAVPDITIQRDGYGATTGPASLVASGTNYDWAKLVMVFAGWPTSESNITVFTRWMRQENGADNWWNRNNPLNNGWGSGGGSGLGSYSSLVEAARYCAESLHKNSGYAGIAAGFAASAPTEQIEAAIWASPWASSHYANGAHWHYTPVDVVKAPADAWG